MIAALTGCAVNSTQPLNENGDERKYSLFSPFLHLFTSKQNKRSRNVPFYKKIALHLNIWILFVIFGDFISLINIIEMMREAQIEELFIKKLEELKYSYRRDIRDRNSLEQNFREKFESLNRVRLTENEFERLKAEIITPDVFAASKLLRERNYFQREDGTPLHYTLVNIKDWCKNEYEVINQLRINTGNSNHRYDVIILINGIPVVQVELKTLEVSPRKAIQQIVDYKNDVGNGYTNSLLCFMQLFIVSNRSDTRYFANNQNQHFSFDANEQFLPVYQLANERNRKIRHLDSFAELFLPKCTLGEMISKYMVLVESEQKILIMRPYQIYAVKAIVNCIHQNRGNGYVWHTTGSGKTLTSFKASTLLKDNPDIEKCLFVVDRKDLDRQTREEFKVVWKKTPIPKHL